MGIVSYRSNPDMTKTAFYFAIQRAICFASDRGARTYHARTYHVTMKIFPIFLFIFTFLHVAFDSQKDNIGR